MIVQELPMWVVYHNPSNHEDSWVARKWLIAKGMDGPTDETIVDAELSVIQGRMEAMDLTRLPRDTSDDPCIVESWI